MPGPFKNSRPRKPEDPIDGQISPVRGPHDDDSLLSATAIADTSLIYLNKLETVLRCNICTQSENYNIRQCPNGHFLCLRCTASMNSDVYDGDVFDCGDSITVCPICQKRFVLDDNDSRSKVEYIMSLYPKKCQYCRRNVRQSYLPLHETLDCARRPANCKYLAIGCEWYGPHARRKGHESVCKQLQKPAIDLKTFLEDTYGIQLYDNDRVDWHDIPFKISKVRVIDNAGIGGGSPMSAQMWQCEPFYSHGKQWMIQCVDGQRGRNPTYKLIALTREHLMMRMRFAIARSPQSHVQINPINVYSHWFNPEQPQTAECKLSLIKDGAERYELLNSGPVYFRIFLMHSINDMIYS